jgi:hypothetical protein
MSNFASGKKAKAISDRSGMAFPQIELKSHKPDRQALQNARSDRTETAAPTLLPLNGLKTASSGTSVITVTEPDHGRSSSDTVRFYGASSFDGITATNINRSAGYTITKVDDNSYTFTVATDTATSGNLRGGGGRAYAGPTTVTA